MKQEIEGWVGGFSDIEDFGFYNSKEDAERGQYPTKQMYEAIDDKFDGKKVRITIEEIK